MTPYELWQLEKYGNIIPETKINEDEAEDYEIKQEDTNERDMEICDRV